MVPLLREPLWRTRRSISARWHVDLGGEVKPPTRRGRARRLAAAVHAGVQNAPSLNGLCRPLAELFEFVGVEPSRAPGCETGAVSPRLRLRRFLYLDAGLTDNFLSQAGSDIYEEEAQTQTSEKGRKLGGGLKAGPAHAEAGGDRASKVTTERTVRRTPEGAFTRLVEVLEAEDAVQYLEALDDEIWNDLRRGEAIEAECNIAVPLLIQIGLLLQSQPIPQIAEAFGTTLDAETETVMGQLATLIGMLKVLPVICELTGSPKYKFVVPLNPEGLTATLDDLNGEATVFGTIEKKLTGRSKWSLLDAIGLGGLPRSARREFDKDVAKAEALRDFTVSAPAAILSPVAIYR